MNGDNNYPKIYQFNKKTNAYKCSQTIIYQFKKTIQ